MKDVVRVTFLASVEHLDRRIHLPADLESLLDRIDFAHKERQRIARRTRAQKHAYPCYVKA